MPKKEVESERKSKRNFEKPAAKVDYDFSDSIASEDEALGNPESSLRSKPATKRSAVVMEGNEAGMQMDFSGEMAKLLEVFGADINKTLVAKRKRLEQYTQESMRTTTKKILDTTKTQCSERKKLVEEFRKQLTSLVEQAETELEKAKEAEEKFQKLILQQQKHQQQLRISQNTRLKALKVLGDQFFKGMEDLEGHHQQQYSSVNNDLKKEMSLLQKKILMDTQQQEMMNVRKSLQSMLM